MANRWRVIAMCLLLPLLLSGCWSSKEIEDLALYAGLALDKGMEDKTERVLEDKGAKYPRKKKLTATLQIIPVRTVGGKSNKQEQPRMPYNNISGTGDSILEIFRQFSIRLDQPVIGHHLKVIIVSAELLKEQPIDNVMDFLLRDNDIRPSTMVFVSQGVAKATLKSKENNSVPAFHIMGMMRNRSRTGKVMAPVTLNKIDSLTYAKKSFALQNLVTADGEVEFSGAGIIKGSSGHWIGTLNQMDAEALTWLRNEGSAGVIKAEVRDEPLTYELKEMKSKISSKVKGDEIEFEVKIKADGRIIEIWDSAAGASSPYSTKETTAVIQKQLEDTMNALISKLQKRYKVDVAGFGDRLAIEQPALWKKVKDNWDEVFSRSKINFTYDVKISEYGSFVEE